jgi:crotonobetainyl-CoA:carnitine CoA-transferase CaiB-like acyl-CoA transferase
MAYQGEARRPDYCGIYIADVLTGTYAFGAIVAALYQRQATGEGQMIDVSMLDSMLSLTLSEIQAAQLAVTPPGRPVFGPIATKDGWINLSIASERTFQSLAAASAITGGRSAILVDMQIRAVNEDDFASRVHGRDVHPRSIAPGSTNLQSGHGASCLARPVFRENQHRQSASKL